MRPQFVVNVRRVNLTVSKSWALGQMSASAIGVILLFLSGGLFFDILAAHPGSDYYSNVNSILGASQGAYWSASNTPESVFAYLLELHFYFWLGILSNFFEDYELLLRLITLGLTSALVFPSLSSATRLKNRALLLLILFFLFVHPRFLDLVIANIRSATALVFVLYALKMDSLNRKVILMAVAATFHLAVLAPIFLYFLFLFFGALPKKFSSSTILTWLAFFAPGVLISMAKVIFPDRGGGDWEGGAAYTISIAVLGVYTFVISKSKAKNQFVFISLGLISLVLWGALLGYSTMRYFSFFFPFFSVAVLLFHRRPDILTVTFILWALFTAASHFFWAASL